MSIPVLVLLIIKDNYRIKNISHIGLFKVAHLILTSLGMVFLVTSFDAIFSATHVAARLRN